VPSRPERIGGAESRGFHRRVEAGDRADQETGCGRGDQRVGRRTKLIAVEAAESPVLIDVWTVDPSREPELLRRILELTRDLLVDAEGFVSAQIYESVDHGAVMIRITMRSVKDRQALTDSAAVHGALRELRSIAQSHSRLFRLVEAFGDAA
jgi:hypothetical protein